MAHYTTDPHQNANAINQYFNTIENPSNPNYKATIKTDRKKVREFDMPCDFDGYETKLYKDEIKKLNIPITKSELHYHTINLRNNKKIYDYDDDTDNLNIIIVKESLPIIDELIKIIFNHWMKTAEVTRNINITALIPCKKYVKSAETIKGYRPLSVEKVICKIYQSIINNKIQRYLTKMNVLSHTQHAGKKRTGAEDCIKAMANTIHTQHVITLSFSNLLANL